MPWKLTIEVERWRGRNSALATVLYATTGSLAAVPPGYAMKWSVWGGGALFSYTSLLGSVLLMIAAGLVWFDAKRAARVALAGTLGLWSFYGPAVIAEARIKLLDRHLEVYIFQWTPGNKSLAVSYLDDKQNPSSRLSDIEVGDLKSHGVTGQVREVGTGSYGHGEASYMIVLVHNTMGANPVEIPEPNATRAIFVEEGGGWRVYPAGTRLLGRKIRLERSTSHSNTVLVTVELVTGARQGFEIAWPDEASP